MGSWFITSQSKFAASENTPAPNRRAFSKIRLSAALSDPSSSPATLTLLAPAAKFVSANARISALINTRRVDETRYCGAGWFVSPDAPAPSFSSGGPSPPPPRSALCSASASSVSALSRSTRISIPPSSRNAAAAALA